MKYKINVIFNSEYKNIPYRSKWFYFNLKVDKLQFDRYYFMSTNMVYLQCLERGLFQLMEYSSSLSATTFSIYGWPVSKDAQYKKCA